MHSLTPPKSAKVKLRHVLEIMTLALSVGIDQIAPFHDSPKTALIEVRKIFNG
jgi:hypothetical protein